MPIVVIGSCTGEKAVDCPNRLTLADFADSGCLAERERKLAPFMRPAAQMYSGDQHVRMMRGVKYLRRALGPDTVNVWILSAGYGLIEESRMIAPYEATFNAMGRREAAAWAEKLSAGRGVRAAIVGVPLALFLLGERYLAATRPPILPEPGQRLVFLAKPSLEGRLRGRGVTVVPAGVTEARKYGCGLVGLKGRMLELLGRAVAVEGPGLLAKIVGDDSPATLLDALGREVRRHGQAG
ncbi:MAG: DUF6884 domain-containing protein [Bacillota bacterium]